MLADEHRHSSKELSQADAEEISFVASAVHECQSNKAKQLWIFDPIQKLTTSDTYEICGTYVDQKPDIWFYFTSSVCPGGNYLLNLFFVHRQLGDVVIGVSDSNKLNSPIEGRMSLPNSMHYFSFKTSKPNENHYIKTYNFPSLGLLHKEYHEGTPNFVEILVIPISISSQTQPTLNADIINYIQTDHFKDFFNKMGKCDYTLETVNKKQYKVHKLILALRSPILKDLVSRQPSNATLDINNEDMELLLEVLYSGVSKDLNEQNSRRLLEMARYFKLYNISSLEKVIA